MRTLKRLALYFKMRCLEATIDGMDECLDLVRHPETLNRITIAQINARRELRHIRAEYRQLRPNRKWRVLA